MLGEQLFGGDGFVRGKIEVVADACRLSVGVGRWLVSFDYWFRCSE